MAKVSLRAYNREIETMIDRGQLDEAIAHCRHILKTYPKHLETYRLLGKANLEYKRYGDAADIFSRILVSAPNDFVAQVGMSIIRDEENRLDDAIWHMERAFETQPSNPAIQAELQRLYARRDGVRPPRIRMTRGALANMYVQGELYPQAISEIKSVLNEDANRADMQALLARACYRSGLKNEAADVASALLKRYPYSYDGNRVMVEMLGAEHPESTQLYRQRVYELDPYAAHVTGSIFQSDEVSDAAVNIERLEWDGQPVSMQPDWSESQAIGLEGGSQGEQQPDWLNRPVDETSRMEDFPSAPSQPTPAPIFETTAPFESSPAQPADDLPDFLREAGWGKSTGTVDESQPAFTGEDAQPSDALEQADLPDWIKAMKPAETEPAPRQEDEELPDWIANIGAGALASQAGDEPAWTEPAEQASEEPAAPAGELPDWMSQLPGETQAEPAAEPAGDLDWLNTLGDTQPTTPVARSDDLDWIKNLGETDDVAAAEPDDLDWMKTLGTSETEPSAISSDEPDWLKGIGEPEPGATAEKDQPDWLRELSSEPQADLSPAAEEETPDWLRQETEPTPAAPDLLSQLTEEPILNTPAEPAASSVDADKLGVSDQERDDSFAWLESLAAKQGATEGLLTRPEDRLEEEPEWVKQAKGLQSEAPAAQPPVEQAQPAASIEDLGKTEQDQDDSFAWLESLAAKQGATEGLLTKPEERLEEEPEWVRRAKDLSAQEQPGIMPEPELGQMAAMQESEPEPEPDAAVDHTAAWMKSLMEETPADFQATAADAQMEEPTALSEPEPAAVDETPDWLRGLEDETTAEFQVTAADAQMEEPTALSEPEPAAVDETPDWLRGFEDETTADFQASAADAQMEEPAAIAEGEPTAPVDEIETWLKDLEGEGTPSGPTGAADETSMWLRGLEEREAPAPEPVETSDVDLPAWMKDITEEPSPAPVDASAGEPSLEATWMPPAEETAPAEPRAEEDTLPSWLSELEKEEEQIATQTDGEDLPEWLRAKETAPSASEPALASDWKPVEAEVEPPVLAESQQSEPMPLPSEPFDMPLEEPAAVSEPEPAAEPEPVMEAPAPAPEPIREPAAGQETGGLNIPLVDPVLGAARSELSGDNVNGALESYGRLIKKARYLDEVIYDLREATYRYPVDVNIWQSLGDAYMRANRLQDALDAYTKAEELLR
ncbi:MAG TPA: tetratricopeptide repeat protein [Anaerolineales bacterium]|nr:tetratricopeptide repeat protein [Anaerolineales bacterium]